MSNGQARVGGEIGVNGYLYKGGQFLPSTMVQPGRWKIGRKWVYSGREMIAPREWAYQPTPFSRSIFAMISSWCDVGAGKPAIREGVRDNQLALLTSETMIRPGVKGVLGKEEIALGVLVEAWNTGQRWFDVSPDAQIVSG